MPGTIQVSVMEFKGLSSTSTPSTFLKVSLGKREYQTSDTGDFSFPLTTLRDNLVVRLLDAEGNEIALTGIQTMSIVEKASWDEIFPLDGGGHVHLKLQFILNEEERNRIRLKREAAVQKKQESIPNVSHKNPEIASSVGSSVTLAPQAEQKVSDSQTSTVHRVASLDNVAMLASQLPNPDVFPAGLQSNYGREEGSILQQGNPKATDKREGTFSAPKISATEAHQIAFEEKLETRPSVPKVDVNLVSGKEHSSDSICTGSDIPQKSNSASLRLEDDYVDKSQQQDPLKKTTSNVWKLVGAFESSLPKDVKSAAKGPTVRSESKKVGKGGPSDDSDPKDVTESAEPSSRRNNNNPFVARDSKPTIATSSRRGENIGSDKSSDSNILSKATKTSERSSLAVGTPVEKELGTSEWTESPAQLERSSTTEKASTSGKRTMNLLGNGPTEAKLQQNKRSSSSSGDTRKHGSVYETKNHQKESHSPRKSRSESSSNEASGGLVGQVIKIAIIVGFGVLVFFTRQQEPRKSKRDTNELFFTTSDYMDEQRTIAEQED